ncbi:MAG: nitrilase-related carbon-nitrogen hydrolase [Cypionkella sp.]|uniref:nitrilase-related carbon-nitrogen hydrolase n=1 Tax=Cypionkella sp. TaxID=2811411 RepID=UPI002ABA89C4|nr:nitrilase-related carbon-nitrogen hydrolase [Cypionkella sp.]MDZ4311294.1 nitrilase-related carbon-nitrogen hydrolase [Cypionkella sp.]
MPDLRLALMQAPSPAGDSEAAFVAVERGLRAAGAAGATVLVVPESFAPGYNSDAIAELALLHGEAWQDRLALACRAAECGLVFGYAERDGDVVYNAALALGTDGTELAHYRKIQLYGPREASIYRPGEAYVTFNLVGHKAALLICYDVEFAPHIAALAAAGVTVLLVPTANMLPYTHVMRATVPAMAANHGISIVYANYCGVEGDLSYAGGSLIVGADGEVLAQAGMGPALLIADVPRVDPARLSSQARDYRAIARP